MCGTKYIVAKEESHAIFASSFVLQQLKIKVLVGWFSYCVDLSFGHSNWNNSKGINLRSFDRLGFGFSFVCVASPAAPWSWINLTAELIISQLLG